MLWKDSVKWNVLSENMLSNLGETAMKNWEGMIKMHKESTFRVFHICLSFYSTLMKLKLEMAHYMYGFATKRMGSSYRPMLKKYLKGPGSIWKKYKCMHYFKFKII